MTKTKPGGATKGKTQGKSGINTGGEADKDNNEGVEAEYEYTDDDWGDEEDEDRESNGKVDQRPAASEPNSDNWPSFANKSNISKAVPAPPGCIIAPPQLWDTEDKVLAPNQEHNPQINTQ
ncbi:hypothetical protein FRC07_008856, partial [Ceratobasidium sp. 392]